MFTKEDGDSSGLKIFLKYKTRVKSSECYTLHPRGRRFSCGGINQARELLRFRQVQKDAGRRKRGRDVCTETGIEMGAGGHSQRGTFDKRSDYNDSLAHKDDREQAPRRPYARVVVLPRKLLNQRLDRLFHPLLNLSAQKENDKIDKISSRERVEFRSFTPERYRKVLIEL